MKKEKCVEDVILEIEQKIAEDFQKYYDSEVGINDIIKELASEYRLEHGDLKKIENAVISDLLGF